MNQRRRNPEPLGIVLIHGAAVVMKGCALVFLGPSGAGKSTITKILQPFTPMIGDDRLYLIPQGNAWLVANATTNRALAGTLTKEEAYDLVGVPLGAVFKLYQDSETRVTPVDTIQTCRYLASAFFEFFWSRNFEVQAQKSIFAQIADISRGTPGFDLHFDKSPRSAAEIHQTIDTNLATK
ncbi:MAG: hypothetical protein BWY63_02362 [Chloroflexi bacterium ADurb.Bin360]|nr:MAG: hypothetical protein BWY63_02362 [Chloroflexi bacterium ADurb.Bin360]